MQLKMLNQINKLLFKPRAPLLGFAITYVQVIKVTTWVMHLIGKYAYFLAASIILTNIVMNQCVRVHACVRSRMCACRHACVCLCVCVTRAGECMHACIRLLACVTCPYEQPRACMDTPISITHILTCGCFTFSFFYSLHCTNWHCLYTVTQAVKISPPSPLPSRASPPPAFHPTPCTPDKPQTQIVAICERWRAPCFRNSV